MEYVNARKVLPDRLIAELQQYASGQLVYIPKVDAGRTKWGQLSGARKELDKRNKEICTLYRQGSEIDELASLFYLSPETIKKIIYTNR